MKEKLQLAVLKFKEWNCKVHKYLKEQTCERIAATALLPMPWTPVQFLPVLLLFTFLALLFH